VGRSSGAYCYTQTKENYLDSNKLFLCYDNTITNAFWVLPDDNFINAKRQGYTFQGINHVTETMLKHIKEVF
jgi:hypothetical protein